MKRYLPLCRGRRKTDRGAAPYISCKTEKRREHSPAHDPVKDVMYFKVVFTIHVYLPALSAFSLSQKAHPFKENGNLCLKSKLLPEGSSQKVQELWQKSQVDHVAPRDNCPVSQPIENPTCSIRTPSMAATALQFPLLTVPPLSSLFCFSRATTTNCFAPL